MQVRAIRLGYYDLKRRKEGAVFTLKTMKGKDGKGNDVLLTPEQQFSSRWMEKVESRGASKAEKKGAQKQEDDEEVI